MDETDKRTQFAKADAATVLHNLDTQATGLSDQAAQTRLARFGHNTIQKGQSQPQWRVFLKNFASLMAILLWVSGIIAMLSGTVELGIAIWLVNVINGLFSYWQERAAKKATDSLMAMLPTYVQVYRNGKLQQLDATLLVPGDVFALQAGNAVPVDARLLEASSLQVDQSALTGESVPESKFVRYEPGSGEFAESNLVYAGTTVGAGTGTAVAYATGMHTEFGKIAALTQNQTKVQSPLTRELNRLTKQISLIAIGIGIAFFLAAIFFVKYPAAKAFIFALGMIVAFIPEGLLPTVTLSLAQGVQRMAKKHALVKDLNSVETLGETTVICSDKTGTLTQNQMTVNYVWTRNQTFKVTGQGYVNNGRVLAAGKPIAFDADPDLKRVVQVVAMNNDTTVTPAQDGGKPKILGTPTEAALVILAQKAGFDPALAAKAAPRVKEFPFDSERKRMCTVHAPQSGDLVACVKGSLSDLLPQCDRIQVAGTVRALTADDRRAINAANEKYAALGLRSLAAAYRTLPREADEPAQLAALTIQTAESGLVFVGLTVMADPPRPEIYDAVAKCHAANIKIIMVTGDSTLTAKSIAVKIGLTSQNARVVTGTELDAMSESALQDALKGEIIFARVAPEQKYKIVSTLQQNGEIVASTGDGVNDAPALKKADIGVAMGVTGTDVAKDAADMILTDDNFASIVAAIEEGRTVYANLQKFLTYILTSNVPEAIPSVLFLFSRGLIPLPMTVMQILTVDLGTDMLPALGLGAEKAEPGIMHQPPRKRSAHLLSRRVMWTAFAWYGLLASAISTFAYFFVNLQNGWPQTALAAGGVTYAKATTMVLGAIVFSQIANALNCRTKQASVIRSGLFANRRIWYGIAFEIALFFVLTVTPGLQGLFNTTPLGLADWAFLCVIPFPLFGLEEARKAWVRRRQRQAAAQSD
ncbi:cation-translocating P-type ATPase [Lacticaseibacillus parakribbianus]|uniref:cation-translocating P-type ATPase n=1 Tax=Lacticaseibacillus parakribbianus TaxID=2970927 RepID=UPI0021CB3F84|nr:cation-transporting P-type ATPase [Lacticaseibacillus parakribbianus]